MWSYYIIKVKEKELEKIKEDIKYNIIGIKDDKISKQTKKIELANKEQNRKDGWLSRIINFFKELI